MTDFTLDLLDAAPDAIVVAGDGGRIVLVNSQTEQLFGYARAELLGEPIEILMPARYHATHVGHRTGYDGDPRARPMGIGLELYGRRRDGSEFPAEVSLSSIDTDGGRIVTAAIRDVTETRRLEREAKAARDLFSSVLDGASETAIIGTDRAGLITVFNRGAERMLGCRAAQVIGNLTPVAFHDPAEVGARAAELGIEPGFEVLVASVEVGVAETREWTYIHTSGARVAVSLTVSTLRDDDGEISGFIGVARDISDARRTEVALRHAERRFQAAFVHAPIGMAIVGIRGPRRGRFIQTNAALAELLGRAPGGLEGVRIATLIHPEDRGKDDELASGLASSEPAVAEKRYVHSDGHTIWTLVSSTVIPDESGAAPELAVMQVLDVSERRRFEGQLRYLADHDALTGLFNRHRFESELDRVAGEARRYGRRASLLLLDLDGFKFVNDRFGHSVGDELVTRIGAILRQTVRETDVVARLGGDEFAVILLEAGEAEAVEVADKIRSAVRRRGAIIDEIRQARVSASIGITTFDQTCELTGEELVVEADIAMYEAKAAGRDCHAVFGREQDHRSAAMDRQSWLDLLRSALDEDRFVLYAQPIVGICGNGIPRFELLLRMVDTTGELIPPGAFLDNAERFDLMGAIDRWVLRSAVKLLHEHDRSGTAVSLSVNLSGKTMNDAALAEDLAAMMKEHPIPRDRLVIEVTETAAIVNIERARELARELRELGCLIALDDFGSGFASFYYLKHLDFDYLKIDGEFIKQLVGTDTDQLVVRAVVDIAQGLGTKTVAEFVGDDSTVDLLRDLGVDYGQGYHLGKPRPLEEVLAELRLLPGAATPAAPNGSPQPVAEPVAPGSGPARVTPRATAT